MLEQLLVFSHLRWNFVYQRPQHLISRLARHYQIYFFEEPVYFDGSPYLEITRPAPNIHVCRPHTPLKFTGFHDSQLPVLRKLLRDLVEQEVLTHTGVWFYTPMALPLLQDIEPEIIVYDCMDELSAFAQAPKQLLQRETALFKVADLVFTGGRSLYQAKQQHHEAVYCFPSSVDKEHFARGRDTEQDHPAQHNIAHPRLGFFGVIDERVDLELLASLADARPSYQMVMVGPVVKIDPADLPQRPNIHYLGQQSYDDLPQFLAGWDVCLLPFALNEATRFISPTKTLEYMVAERPIVSTPITDVVEPYGHIVYGAADVSEFIVACDNALHAALAERDQRTRHMRDTLASTSWDETAEAMRRLLDQTLAGRHSVGKPAPTSAACMPSVPPLRKLPQVPAPSQSELRTTVILGAGPTGLSAAYHLGRDSLLLEQHDRVGGWCRSVHDRGFTFDYAGHIMFSNDPYVLKLYDLLLGDNVHWQDREAWIYSKQVYTRYPFQGSLYGLPPDVLKECIVGAIEARFGELKRAATPEATTGSSTSACKAESITDCCGDGIAESTAPLHLAAAAGTQSDSPRNFEEFIYKVWGQGVAKHFAIPYNRKLWAVPLHEMETSWLGGRVPMPDLEEMIEGALRPMPKPMGPNARFGYPKRGGFQALMEGFLPHLRGELRTNARVVGIQPADHRVVLADGSAYRYRQLISTLPLPKLIKTIGSFAPAAVRQAANRLRHVSVRCVNLGIGRANISDKHWIYYPEDTVFHRIFLQGNASPLCNPPGGFGLTCEITYSPYKPLPDTGAALIARCIRDAIRVGLIREDDPILTANEVDMPYAYVLYDHERAHNVSVIRDWLWQHDITLAGRYSEWEYYNSDHAFLAGRKAADSVTRRLESRSAGVAI